MHDTVLIKYFYYYKSNIISKNKATNLLEQQFCPNLGACKINYCLLWMKLNNDM